MTAFRFLCLLVPLLLACAGCNPKGRTEEARRLADTFHSRYQANDYPGMYALGGRAVQKSATQDRFVAYQKDVHARLGDLLSAEVGNFNLLYVLTGPQVRLDYRLKFAKGTAAESFEITWEQSRAVISGYRLDSPLLQPDSTSGPR